MTSSNSTTAPSEELIRDTTGSYLHLKLKRYPLVTDLTMSYAKKTWAEHPHDAEIDISSSARSKCRHCHSMIGKGALRARLWLQCHKGCKNSAYFHGTDCIWNYPETAKIESIKEFVGLEELPEAYQKQMHDQFEKLNAVRTSAVDGNTNKRKSPKKTEPSISKKKAKNSY
jgi:hypothetical protein